MGTSKPTDASTLLAGTQNPESRDQVIFRRRSAQRAWHTARINAEQAALDLRETPPGPAAPPSTARTALERARLAESTARAAYQRVAEETGTLLGRLTRVADEKHSAAEQRTRTAHRPAN
jgi:hypothetical protein